MSMQREMSHVFLEAKRIVWNECTIAHKISIEAINRALQVSKDRNRLRKGVTVLLFCGFRQICLLRQEGHVQMKSRRVSNSLSYCVMSKSCSWQLICVPLSINCEQKSFRTYYSILVIWSCWKVHINILIRFCQFLGDLISLTGRISPNIHQATVNKCFMAEGKSHSTPTIDYANSINNIMFNKLSTEHMRYESLDSVMYTADAVPYSVGILHTLDPQGLHPHVTCVKVGAPIIHFCNLNTPTLCNGTRFHVKSLHRHVIDAMSIFTDVRKIIFIPRIPLVSSVYYFEFKHLQFLVKVCYVMTINKAQRQCMKVARGDLSSECFSDGQLYVTCSKVSSSADWSSSIQRVQQRMSFREAP